MPPKRDVKQLRFAVFDEFDEPSEALRALPGLVEHTFLRRYRLRHDEHTRLWRLMRGRARLRSFLFGLGGSKSCLGVQKLSRLGFLPSKVGL